MVEATRNTRLSDLKNIPAFLIHPRRGVERMATEEKAAWPMPLLVISIMFLLRTIVSGYLQARASSMGQTTLPADWQWWTADMQNNYMQAIQATQGPVFVYIIPAVIGLVKIWLGGLVLSGLLHLASTLLGGRGSMRSVLNLAAWAFLPFALRDVLRVGFMLITRHLIISPGLSGFGGGIFLSKVLASVDVFFIWFAILLVMGLRVADILPGVKAIVVVVIVLLLVLLVQGGLGTLSANLGGMIITRPFF
jgi:Yip1 domain